MRCGAVRCDAMRGHAMQGHAITTSVWAMYRKQYRILYALPGKHDTGNEIEFCDRSFHLCRMHRVMQRAIGTASDWELGLRCCSCNPELPGFFLLLFILKVVLLSCLSDARCCYSPVAASEGIINTAVLTAIFCVVWVGDPCSKPNWNWKLALRIVGQRFSCPHILYFSLAWAFNESKILEKGKWHGPTHHEAAVSMQPTPDPFSWPLPLSFP